MASNALLSQQRPDYSITLDRATGIVRVSGLILATPSDVDRYVAELDSVVREARLLSGKARVLADLRHSPVRSQDAAERLRHHNSSLYRPGERVALLVASALLALQLKRNLVADLQAVFVSEAEAEAWLLAD